MKKKSTISIFLVLTLILSMALTGCGKSETLNTENEATAEPVTFSIAGYLPSGNLSETYCLNPIMEGVSERTNGEVNFKYYAGGTLAPDTEILDATINGVADLGVIATAYYTGRLPLCFLDEYPVVSYNSSRAASYTFKEYIEKLKPAELNDVKVITVWCSGQGMIATQKPVKVMADLKGMEIRANAIAGQTVNAMGGVAAALPMSECYEALRSGIVQGYMGLTESISAFNLSEVVKYGTYFPYNNVSFMLVMNKDKWDSLTPEQQNIIDEVANATFEGGLSGYFGEVGAQKTVDQMTAKGNEIFSFSDEDLAKITTAVTPVVDNYVKELDTKGLDGTGALALLKELAEKNNDLYPTDVVAQ